MRYWAPENSHEVCARPLHNENVTVWCAVSHFGIIGPYFLKDGDWTTITVNSGHYVRILHNFFQPSLIKLIQNIDKFSEIGA